MSKSKGHPRKRNEPLKKPEKDFSALYTAFWLCTLILATWILYAPTLNFELTNWDEKHYIFEQAMTRGLTWDNIQSMFSRKVLGSYNPLVLVSFAFDHDFGHSKASWYHGINLFFHVINTLILFFIMRKLGIRIMIAGFIAALFALHPMHVESVAWVASRKDVLMGFFMFSSWWLYMKSEGGKKWIPFSLSVFLFLLALLSKAQAVTLPLILILSDYYIQKSWNWKWLLNKIPFFILSILFGIIAVSGSTFSADKYAMPLSFLEKISYSLVALTVYVIKSVLPFSQSAIYAFPASGSSEFILQLSLGVLILVFCAWTIGRYYKTKPALVFGILFFLVNTFLTLHIVAVNSSLIYERFTYISYIGLFFLLVLIPFNFKQQRLIPLILAFYTLGLSYAAGQRLKVWKNSITLWTDTIEKNPESNEAYNNRGDYYNSNGDLDKAYDDFINSTRVAPRQPNAHNNLAVIWFKRNDLDKALVENQKAIDIDPEYAQAISNRGILFFNKGMLDSAEYYYHRALSILPDYPFALCNLGSVFLKSEQPDSAIYYYKRALQLQSNYPDASKYMGLAFLQKEEFDSAEKCMYDALRMNSSSDALVSLSTEYLALASKSFHRGETDKAIRFAEKSIQYNPANAEAYYNLGGYYMTRQDLARTREYWKKALQINPSYKEAREWLDRIGAQ